MSDRKRALNLLAGFVSPKLLFLLGLIVAGGIAAYVFLGGGEKVSTDNAYVKANRVTISAEVSGRLVGVYVKENQTVKAGSVLFKLDDEPYRIAVSRLEAELGDTRNEILSVKARYRESEAKLRRANEDLQFAKREVNRVEKLAGNDLASESQLDQAQHSEAQSRQSLEAIKQEISALLAELGGDPEAPAEEHPRYVAAKAELEHAQLQLSHTVMYSPANGLVTQMERFRPGEFVQAGKALFSLIETDNSWIEANLKETELENVRPGQSVAIEIDAYPGRKLEGVVASIGVATGAEFSVLPPQNATGNWIKVTQRIPVRIELKDGEETPALRLGMSAKVIIDIAGSGA